MRTVRFGLIGCGLIRREMACPSLTGGISEAGFSDSILQMWAAFLYEMEHRAPIRRFAGCVKPEEAAWSHRLFTAALEFHRTRSVVQVESGIPEL